MKTLLLQFSPPESEIRLKHCLIRSGGFNEYNISGQSFRGYEIMEMDSHLRMNERQFSIAEVAASDVKPDQVYAIANLITGRWRALYQRSRRPLILSGGAEVESEPKLKLYRFTEDRLNSLDRGIALLATSKRFRIAMERWNSALYKSEHMDTVLDLCMALEASFGFGSELRLRIAIAVRSLAKRNKLQATRLAYEMYGIRSAFVHGNDPCVEPSRVSSFTEMTSDTLYSLLSRGRMPSGNELMRHVLG